MVRRRILTALLALASCLLASLALAGGRPIPLPDQAHLLHVFLSKRWDKPSPTFEQELKKMVATYIPTWCATNACKDGFADPEIFQVIPYDMDTEEGDEILVVWTPADGSGGVALTVLDWVDAKWMFVPLHHKGWDQVDSPQDADQGEVVRKTEFWGLRWMEWHPVVVGHRVVSQKGPEATSVETEEMVFAWFDWQNKEAMAAVALRSARRIATSCAETLEVTKGWEAFLDVDWDLNEELVVYDVAWRKDTKRTASGGVCDAVPEKPQVEERWIGPTVYRMSEGEMKRLEGDAARLLLLRCAALEWLDEEPCVGVLGVFRNAAQAFEAKEALHQKEISTMWVVDGAQYSMLASDPRFLLTTTPRFGKEACQQACDMLSAKVKTCVPTPMGKPAPADLPSRFPPAPRQE